MSSSPDSNHAEDDSVRSGSMHLLQVLHLLRVAGGDVLTQVALHGQLAKLEWAEEKRRLAAMLAALMLGAAALLCVMMSFGVLLLAVSWDTEYRIAAILAMIAVYAIGLGFIWQYLAMLSARGSASFAATREELEADLALLKDRP